MEVILLLETKQILGRSIEIWKSIETSLSRGNNVAEGHHVECLWGFLLSLPLTQDLIDQVYKQQNEGQDCQLEEEAYLGVITKSLN
jgi:hypothetical protein